MSIQIEKIKSELYNNANPEKVEGLKKYMRAYPGGYGEGDLFIGVNVPTQRKVAKKYFKAVSLEEVDELLKEKVHEYRLTALFILVNQFNEAKNDVEKKAIVELYLNNYEHINNWDLVDSSAEHILGAYLFDKVNKGILYEFAESNHLWKQRIAIIATFFFIKRNQFDYTFEIAEILLHHNHDLIHKAVGWMLREIGNRDISLEVHFLQQHYKEMPRTMLRYAIEKFEPESRQKFMKGLI